MTAFIPYGAYWSTPFARWQGAFSHLHSIEFAAHVARDALSGRKIAPAQIDFCAYGMTVIQPNCFYATPWFTAIIGAERLPGPTLNQACATGQRLLSHGEDSDQHDADHVYDNDDQVRCRDSQSYAPGLNRFVQSDLRPAGAWRRRW